MKYKLRFSIVYVIIMVLLSSFFITSINEQQAKLKTTQSELNGVEYLKILYSLSINVAYYQGSILVDDAEHNRKTIQNKIKNDIHKVHVLQKRFPEFQSDILNNYLDKLLNSPNNYHYYEFLDFINHENYRIGDISKLLFEENRQNYFLSSLITHYMPEYLISSVIAHNIVEVIRFNEVIDKKSQDLFIEQNKLILLSSEEIGGIIELLKNYKETKKLSLIKNEITTLIEDSQQYIDSIKNLRINTKEINEYIKISHKILKLSEELNDENIHLIEHSLNTRVEFLNSKISYDIILLASLIILITIILLYLYYSFTSNIKKDIEIKNINNTLDKLVIFSKTDINGVIQYVSSALENLSGYSRTQIIGNTHAIFKHEDMDDSVYTDMWNTILAKKIWIGELKNRAKDGSSYWVKATISPDLDENGEIIGFSAYRVDISDHKELEIEKAKTQKALEFKSQFLSNMSHEIRTPLNAIVGLTYVTLKSGLNEKQKDLINKVQSASNILLGVINDILDISKIESGKMTIEEEVFSLKDTVQTVIDILLPKAQEQGITLDLSCKDMSNCNFMGDSLRISQVLTNLINNAIKFTSEGGVSLNIQETKNDTILFEVIDTGIGLKDEYIKTLFDEFTQADMSTSRKYGGTGLGLSISKHLVELMHGKIWVKSDFGVGSTFSFELPLEVATKVEITKENDAQDMELLYNYVNNIENIKILVAEDNPMNQMVLKMLLEDSKLDIEFADDGKIAVDKFQNNNYKMIFMDIQMPYMNGFEATEYIRETNSDIPIVALSANAMREDIDKALACGMNDYLSKPINVNKLYSTLSKYLKV